MILRAPLPTALLVSALVAAAGPAAAQVREAPTAVSPVTVMPPTLPPKVVATYPAQGQTIAPGVLILKVTFDQQMSPGAWNYAAAPDAPRPECLQTPRLLNDSKTFVLLCRVQSSRAYKVAFNGERAGGGFANLADNPAEPQVLAFQVARGEPVTSIAAALAAAGLKDHEAPVQDTPGLAAASANAAPAAAARP